MRLGPRCTDLFHVNQFETSLAAVHRVVRLHSPSCAAPAAPPLRIAWRREFRAHERGPRSCVSFTPQFQGDCGFI